MTVADTDYPPFSSVNGEMNSELLIICDHASNHVPLEFDNLGLPPERLREHIAIDIGAEAVARGMAERLQCTALLSGTSRLVIDCNRLLEDPTSIPSVSDDVVIPGNQNLSDEERRRRIERFFKPYHSEMRHQVDRRLAADVIPAIISVHSFTPEMAGFARPWQISLLWDRDPRLAPPLIEYLRRDSNLVVGDNEPYSGVSPHGYALKTYGVDMGLPLVLFEIRQDLVENSEGIDYWIEKLSGAVSHVLADKSIFRIAHY